MDPEPTEPEKKIRKTPKKPRTPSGKRSQARPYRKLSDEIIATRITKLTTRLERSRKQVLS
jgi:hypothetical protein